METELPGVKVVGFIDLSKIKEPINLSHKRLRKGQEALEELFEEVDEVYWEDQKRRFEWLQEMYRRGYTYEEIFG